MEKFFGSSVTVWLSFDRLFHRTRRARTIDLTLLYSIESGPCILIGVTDVRPVERSIERLVRFDEVDVRVRVLVRLGAYVRARVSACV